MPEYTVYVKMLIKAGSKEEAVEKVKELIGRQDWVYTKNLRLIER